jgi:hypothetical protein
VTVNRKDHPKIPTYDLTAVEIAVRPPIPRDPGNSWADEVEDGPDLLALRDVTPLLDQSPRMVTMGSTRVPRYAGTAQAATAVARRRAATPRKVTGSSGLT